MAFSSKMTLKASLKLMKHKPLALCSAFIICFVYLSTERKRNEITSLNGFHGKKNIRYSFAHEYEQRSDWSNTETPQFCKRLIDDPKPCIWRGNESSRCKNVPNGNVMFSSNQQDYYLYTRHFAALQRPGVYVDLASNNPIWMSNTYFFDRCLGWRGLCIEANDEYFEPIYRERSCTLVPTCVSKKDGQVMDFVMQGVKGGVVSDQYKYRSELSDKSASKNVRSLRCSSMMSILNRNGVTHIDYLSLDVEGLELSILQSIDWENIVVDVMTVEKGPRISEIEKFLLRKGYRRHQINGTTYELTEYKNFMGSDLIFAHESISFGQPNVETSKSYI